MSSSCSSTNLEYKQLLFRSAARFQEEEDAFLKEVTALKKKIQSAGEHMHKQFGKVRERMVFMHELDKTMESDSVQQLGKPDSLTTGTVSSRSTSTTREVFPDETDQMAQRLLNHLATLPREKRLPVTQKLLHDLGKLCTEDEKEAAAAESKDKPKDEGKKADTKQEGPPPLLNGETVPTELTTPELGPRDSAIVTQMLQDVAEQPAQSTGKVTAPPPVKPSCSSGGSAEKTATIPIM